MAQNGKNDNLIEDYRNIITNILLDDPVIVGVLGNDKIPLDESDVLLDGKPPHIQPYEFLPNVLTETGSYIMYDMDEEAVIPRGSANSTYSEVALYFWVVTHRNMARYKGQLREYTGRLRNDILSRRLKQLFDDRGGLGIAKNHFLYNKIFDVGNNDYMGRVLKFVITDWSDKVRWRYDRKNKPVGA